MIKPSKVVFISDELEDNYNSLYKIVTNCLIGFLSDYVSENRGRT